MQFVYLKEAFCPSLEERVQVRPAVLPGAGLPHAACTWCCAHTASLLLQRAWLDRHQRDVRVAAVYCGCAVLHGCKATVAGTLALPQRQLVGFATRSKCFPDPLQTLYDAFGVDGRLVVNYALTPAWG